jgi:hypothetical protein
VTPEQQLDDIMYNLRCAIREKNIADARWYQNELANFLETHDIDATVRYVAKDGARIETFTKVCDIKGEITRVNGSTSPELLNTYAALFNNAVAAGDVWDHFKQECDMTEEEFQWVCRRDSNE